MYTPSVSVTCCSGTCRLLAFSRSMVTRNCGSLAVKLLYKPVRSLRALLWRTRVLRGFGEFFEGVPPLILQFVLEAAKLAEALHRGRKKGQHQSSRDAKQAAPNPVHDGFGGMLVALALLIGLQGDEDDAEIGRISGKTEAADGESAFALPGWDRGSSGSGSSMALVYCREAPAGACTAMMK